MPNQQSQQQGSPFEMVTSSKPKKLTPKNLIIIIVALMFLSVSVFLGVYLVGKRTNVAQKASPATAMFITPGSQTKSPGTNFSFSVDMDTSTNAVTGIDVRLIFNPAVVQILSIQQGSGITNLNQTITNTYDNTAGTVSFAVFTLDSSKSVTGSGVKVLTVNATVKSGAVAGSSNITFDPATAASASQEGQNVLISKSQGVVVVSSASGSSTASPTATATSRATATATATATSRATATATATSNATASPTATATSDPSATDTATPDATQSSPLPIPVTGTNWPTYLGAFVAVFIIIASVVLAI